MWWMIWIPGVDKHSDDTDVAGCARDLEESYSESRLELMWADRRISVPSVCMYIKLIIV